MLRHACGARETALSRLKHNTFSKDGFLHFAVIVTNW